MICPFTSVLRTSLQCSTKSLLTPQTTNTTIVLVVDFGKILL